MYRRLYHQEIAFQIMMQIQERTGGADDDDDDDKQEEGYAGFISLTILNV